MRTTDTCGVGRARLRCGAAGVALLAVAACSAGDAADTRDSAAPEPAIAAPDIRAKRDSSPSTEAATATTAPATTAPTTTVPAPVPVIEVEVGVGPSTTVLAAEVDPAVAGGDPFGQFTACSGLEDSVGAWTLQISQPDSELSAVGIMTTAPVDGPGEFEATFRIEWHNGGALDAHGLLTLEPGLQAGSFVSDDFDVAGNFRCEDDRAPEALGQHAVEVYALMRRGGEQRIVSVAAPADEVACPVDEPGPLELVASAAWGTISRFRIGTGDLSIAIGEHDLALDAAAVQTFPGPGAGTFHAETVDGTVIDGAYRCAS